MPVPDTMIVDGKAVSWSRVREKRREMVEAARQVANRQPALFELHIDRRPAVERTASSRLQNPSLFDWSPNA